MKIIAKQKKIIVTIDGNDGTGKTSTIHYLKEIFPNIQFLDRGLPSKMTENDQLIDDGRLHIILIAPVSVCQYRLQKRGADLNEKYHNKQDLTFYHKRFCSLHKRIKNIFYINSNQDIFNVVSQIQKIINKFYL